MIWPVLRPYVIQHPCTEQEESILEEFYLCGLLAAISSWVKEEEPLPKYTAIQLESLNTVLQAIRNVCRKHMHTDAAHTEP